MMDVHQANLTDEPRNKSDPVRVIANFRFSMVAIHYGTVLGSLQCPWGRLHCRPSIKEQDFVSPRYGASVR